MDEFFKYEKPTLKKVNLVQVLWSTKMALSPEDENTSPFAHQTTQLSFHDYVCLSPQHSSFTLATMSITFLYAENL